MKITFLMLSAALALPLAMISIRSAGATEYTYTYTGPEFDPAICEKTQQPGETCLASGNVTAVAEFSSSLTGYTGITEPDLFTISSAGYTLDSRNLYSPPYSFYASLSRFYVHNGTIYAWRLSDAESQNVPKGNGNSVDVLVIGISTSADGYGNEDYVNGQVGNGATALTQSGTWTPGGTIPSNPVPPPPPPKPPPTITELAKMSAESYNVASIAPVDSFKSVQSINGTAGFFAQIYQNGNQVVVAFRGSVFEGNEYDNLKSIAADKSFVLGQPTSIFQSDVSQATALLKTLEAEPQFAGDNFTLTGHSLGGAIAQLEGNATGLPTTAFDAPGAGKLISALSTQLNFGGTSFVNSGTNTNIRLYGDQVSVVGQAIGTQETLANNIFAEGNTIANPELTVIEDHSIETIVDQLQAGATIQQGVAGPTLNLDLALVAGLGNLLTFVVSPMENVELDPPSANIYELNGTAGSPFLNTLTLPFLPSVASYDVESDTGGVWSPSFSLAPGQAYAFGSGVTGVEFWGLNNIGQTITLPSQFIFDVSFSTGGTFNGTLTGFGGGVPEPSSWILLIFGLGFTGGLMRQRRVSVLN